MHQVAEVYPQTVPYLERLPDHVADHLGEMALRLSHEDMFAKGGPHNEVDFNQVIAAPEDDSNKLAVDAYEAAQLGEQKVAGVLLESSKLLATAHEKLEAGGTKFGATDVETDDARDARELKERSTVYEAACSEAVSKALAAKEQGDTAGVDASLESLILLHSLRSEGIRSYNTPDGHRAVLRSAVREGLGDELLTATQASQKLFVGTEYKTVAAPMGDAKALLELSTGKKLEYDFSSQTDGISYGLNFLGRENERDLLAVMASPYSKTSPDRIFDAFPNSSFMLKIHEHANPDAQPGELGSFQYFDKIFGESVVWEQVDRILECTNPQLVLDTMQTLGIKEDWKASALFGYKADPNQPMPEPYAMDEQLIKDMVVLKQAHPDHFANLIDKQDKFGTLGADGEANLGYQPLEVMKGVDALIENGFDTPEMLQLVTKTADMEVFVQSSGVIRAACEQAGIATDALPGLAKKANMRLDELWDAAAASPENLATAMQDVLCLAEIHDAYGDYIRAIPQPLPEKMPKFTTEQLAHLTARITSLGLTADVSTEIVKSWGTYSALHKTLDNFKKSNKPREEAFTERSIDGIVHNQQYALKSQIKALEAFTNQYGLAVTKGVIAEFGIYNFKRHDPAKLADQYERWMSGGVVKSVVAEARSDWNSFAGQQAVFAEEVGEGVFYFEANSAKDVARVAVLAGRHERKNGREPDVARFIVHAHANGTGLLMGVNGELIDLAAYETSAQGVEKLNAENVKLDKKISAREVNDYRRHLGPNFEVILQGCSTAEELAGLKNIAETINERHDTKVTSSTTTIFGLTIHNDGSVTYKTDEGDHEQVIYR